MATNQNSSTPLTSAEAKRLKQQMVDWQRAYQNSKLHWQQSIFFYLQSCLPQVDRIIDVLITLEGKN